MTPNYDIKKSNKNNRTHSDTEAKPYLSSFRHCEALKVKPKTPGEATKAQNGTKGKRGVGSASVRTERERAAQSDAKMDRQRSICREMASAGRYNRSTEKRRMVASFTRSGLNVTTW